MYSKAQVHLRPRYKMLLLIVGGQTSSQELAAKTGVSRNTIAIWKRSYSEGGVEQLTSDLRGGDFKSNISASDKKNRKEIIRS
jgi:transposase